MTQISIAMCTYNGGKYLAAQLDSVLAQTVPPLELCVGDDGSTDATLDILDRFAATAPFPVTVTRNPVNLGYGENFIQTAKRCAGDWIAFCDQDDLWLPTKLERCAELIHQGPPDLRLVVHNAAIVDSGGKVLADMMREASLDWAKDRTFAKNELPPVWMMYGNCMIFDQSLVHDVSSDGRAWPCFTAEPHEAHDSWIPILAATLGSVTAASDRLLKYRRHGANVSGFLLRPSVHQRLIAKLRPDAEYFDLRAHQLGSLADRLAERVDAAGRDEYKVDLATAATRYADLASAYRNRALVARGDGVAARLRALRQLVGSGVYQAPDGWGFGKSGMFKDLFHALIGKMV